MKLPVPLTVRSLVVAGSLLLQSALSHSASAVVLALGFDDGQGTSSVDQYTGIAGSGWNTAWTTANNTNVSSSAGTVINTTPVSTGGGNYLNMNFAVTGAGSGNGTQNMRLSRQVNSTQIDLTQPVQYSFTIRPDSVVSNANLTFTIFNTTAATMNTGANDTWKISASGGGWNLYDGNSLVTTGGPGLVGASSLQGTSYQFTITSDPTAKQYTVSILNLNNGTAYNSAVLAWRSTAGTEAQFLNFVANGGAASAASFGYSLDNVSVTQVPEPGPALLGGIALAGLLVRRRRRRCPGEPGCAATSTWKAPASQGAQGGFTLIELLTAMAIIAVLASLGIVAYSRVKHAANATKCASSLRQWGMGYQQYISDNDGDLPQASAVSGNNDSSWQEKIAPYLVGKGKTDTEVRRFEMRLKFRCPGDKTEGIVYGSIHYLNPNQYGKAPQKLINLEQDRSRYVLMAENYTGELWDVRPWDGRQGVDYVRHGGNKDTGHANFLFADFHIEALTYKETQRLPVITIP